jgi:hypothetical protein
MILIYATLFIAFEAITEALIKLYCPKLSVVIFKWWLQWIIAIALFAGWFVIALNFDKYYVPVWKLIAGFVFVRALIFTPIYNIVFGNPIGFYGTSKWYDRQMKKLGSWGWMVVIILGIMGICFLMGWDGSHIVKLIKSIL